mmetsp:Transcript_51999/g.70969  ORF Transcript_51999/g.70969 Transcript_51999/m.70969 type:complete len:484 (-) Transcript_51999:331-1782(-)|eukprot:CAMPEP_0185766946 /NCGR_PEP_ID=MMETSP1174-20130828/40365_1 /TAXON_ID=35687 /ORGANISM="Dictyocha speculum, Strain CCMP1381" /LENGTH=483 /DNA_ID=CAMNT_0028450893 /DNA_START=13 /DNA_END=1464 /DNA_ORIENTATION=-
MGLLPCFPVLFLACASLGAARDSKLEPYPRRSNSDAALLEWGHSAVIHAADAVIANFGAQAEDAEFVLGIEASPVLARPLQGCEPLRNSAKLQSQMAFMMRGGCDFMTKARHAMEAGATALVIINHDQTRPDHAFAMDIHGKKGSDHRAGSSGSAAKEAGEVSWNGAAPDIPCVMVSWNSGQAILEDKPDRLRLYPGGERAFIEGVSDDAPVVYLIHNMLTAEECDHLKEISQPRLKHKRGVDSENGIGRDYHSTTLYHGAVLKGALAKAIDERVFSIIGFPTNYFADLQVVKFNTRGMYEAHYDWLPSVYEEQVMTVVYCLDTVEPQDGGAMQFPRAAMGKLHIQPQRGMAIVYHNSLEDGTLDRRSIHANLKLMNGTMWTANQYIYATPVSPARRWIMPLLVLIFGGTPAPWMRSYMTWCQRKFGVDQGYICVSCTLYALALLVLLPFLIGLLIVAKQQLTSSSSGPPPKRAKKSNRKKKD